MKNKILVTVILTALIGSFSGCTEKSSSTTTSDTSTTTTTSLENTSSTEKTVEEQNNTLKASGEDTTSKSSVGNINDTEIKVGEEYAAIKIKGFNEEIIIKLYPEAAPKAVENFKTLINDGYYTGKKIHRIIPDFMFQGGSKNGDGMSTAGEPQFEIEVNQNMRHIYGALCMANAGGINGSQFYIVNDKTKNVFTDFKNESLGMIKEYANYYYEEAQKNINEQEYYEYNMKKSLELARQVEYIENASGEVSKVYDEKGGTPFLDGNYTVFGQTVEGFDTIDRVSKLETIEDENESSTPVDDVIIEKVEIKVK